MYKTIKVVNGYAITRYCVTKCVSRSAVYEHLAIARKIFWAIAHHKG